MKSNSTNYEYFWWILGFAVPFAVVGPQIAIQSWITPSIVISTILVFLYFPRKRVSIQILAAGTMLLLFLITAIGRHQPATYLPSLIFLTLTLFPIFLKRIHLEHSRKILRGFKVGFIVTSLVAMLEILLQITGQHALYETLRSVIFPNGVLQNPHNWLGLYYRPLAFFAEPSHYGLYLFLSFVVFLLRDKFRVSRLSMLAIFMSLISGSLVGIVAISTTILFSLLVSFIYRSRHFALSLKTTTTIYITVLFLIVATCKRLQALGMNVIGYDPAVSDVDDIVGLQLATWPERIAELDFLIFTCSLNAHN